MDDKPTRRYEVMCSLLDWRGDDLLTLATSHDTIEVITSASASNHFALDGPKLIIAE